MNVKMIQNATAWNPTVFKENALTKHVILKAKVPLKMFATKLATALVIYLQEDRVFARCVVTNLNSVKMDGVACPKKEFVEKMNVILKIPILVKVS
jgi:hypothetical protein